MNKFLISSFMALIMGLSPGSVTAQTVAPTSDIQKQKQLNSIENGGWDFAPDYYYYLFHKNYSGAELYWTTELGFIPVPHVRFKEPKSNVKRTSVPRLAQVLEALELYQKSQSELDTIKPVYQEEMLRTAERNVDMMYSQYKNDFNDLQTNISENLNYCLEKSNGKLYGMVDLIKRENDLVLEEIAYTHKEGIGYEMENTKRQILYEESLQKMKDIAGIAAQLVLYSKSYY